jgi:hypothetical protein
MHALNYATNDSCVPIYGNWAMERAQAVHGRITVLSPSGRPSRMYRKLSIGVTRPLVASMWPALQLQSGIASDILDQAVYSESPQYAARK